jgi:hypothetical protein
LGTEETVEDDRNRDEEQKQLQRGPGEAPVQKRSDDRDAQDIHALGCWADSGDFDLFLELESAR